MLSRWIGSLLQATQQKFTDLSTNCLQSFSGHHPILDRLVIEKPASFKELHLQNLNSTVMPADFCNSEFVVLVLKHIWKDITTRGWEKRAMDIGRSLPWLLPSPTRWHLIQYRRCSILYTWPRPKIHPVHLYTYSTTVLHLFMTSFFNIPKSAIIPMKSS